MTRYDLILAGTGFASTFFLLRYLELAPAKARVLVLEKGVRRDHAWWIAEPTRAGRYATMEQALVAENRAQGPTRTAPNFRYASPSSRARECVGE